MYKKYLVKYKLLLFLLINTANNTTKCHESIKRVLLNDEVLINLKSCLTENY